MIAIDKAKGTFSLHTKHCTYQMWVEEHGVLLHTYYGPRVDGQDFSYLIQRQDRAYAANPPDAANDRTFSLDTLLQEYSSFGAGDFRESCLDVRHQNGGVAADLRYCGCRVCPGKEGLPGLPASFGTSQEANTLEIELKDRESGICVTLQYAVFYKEDVITRSARIHNGGGEPITLERALSCCIDLPVSSGYDVMTFYGKHMGEKQVERTPLRRGKIRVDSVRGASSPHQSPFVILCNSNATEAAGECMAFSFVYSGSFLAQVEVDQIEQTRFVMGIHPQSFSWQLEPGESFQTPEVLCCYSNCGLDTLSNNLHSFQLRHLLRGEYRAKRCPVLINSWEAMYFDFDDEKLLAWARAAKDLGIELLVLDDGWFGVRNDDTTSLGDWKVNRKKLKHGIGELGRKLHDMGLYFGLWFEPEMVSPDSELMRAHPEWCIGIPGCARSIGRSQYVLDMSRGDVVEYLFEKISAVLKEGSVDYLKWDMNRNITDAWSALLPPQRQGEFWHRYILGVYALMERLLLHFPKLLLENCASGGGRYDAGMLYYSPQIWCSDNTDAIARLKIQYGTSFGFPIRSIGSHVAACPSHQTGRTTPFSTRAVVAMSGTFGYELNPGVLNEMEKNAVQIQIKQYKKLWETVCMGSYHRLTNPMQNGWYTAWMSVSQDKKQAVVSCVVTDPQANAPVLRLYLRGLLPDVVYCDGSGNKYKGAALMHGGLVLPMQKGNYPALQIVLKMIEK